MTPHSIIQSMILSFVLTLLIEELCVGLFEKPQIYLYVLVFLVNLLTNPLLVFLFCCFEVTSFWVQIPAEIAVVFVEGIVFSRFRRRIINGNPFRLALYLNLISWGTGVILQMIL